jgi:hypothetical protein
MTRASAAVRRTVTHKIINTETPTMKHMMKEDEMPMKGKGKGKSKGKGMGKGKGKGKGKMPGKMPSKIPGKMPMMKGC